ncbi:hypothetical protein HU200_008433 [Digitaria exilis]|uniref:Uncharacterized protein n=1 Tax=Digitaria exilis TaxID=1010633 RepID=A0A835FNU7_9POAL|nr:hypothetical protein HU200_008433 [Digitaria exilis]
MKITVHSSKPVKPVGAVMSPGGGAPDVVPLSVFDRANFNTYISVIYVFWAPTTPPNAALEAGLARALAEYREWAGRLAADGHSILLTDDGARVVQAIADVPLDAVLPLLPDHGATRLHPSDDGAEELMLVQLTRFACGGLAVGFTTHHLVSDGRATTNFFVAWSQATRREIIVPTPVHDRVSFFKPRVPPRVEFDHRTAEFKKPPVTAPTPHAGDDEVVVVHRAHFSREFIARLKSQASSPARPCSMLRCLAAHLWRRITAARGLAGDVSTSVCIAVDGRARMRPPELIDGEIGRIDGDYFASFVDFAASGAVEEEGLVPAADAAEMVLSPNVEVDSWLRIPFYDLDFGGGRPCFFMPSYLPVEGLVILLPSCYGDGSVDAYVSLFSRHVDAFKSCCYSIDDDLH